MKQMLDIYPDYLLASFSQTSATGLSRLMNGEISHDQVTRFLASEMKTSKDLWHLVKPYQRISMAQSKNTKFDEDNLYHKALLAVLEKRASDYINIAERKSLYNVIIAKEMSNRNATGNQRIQN